MTNAIKILTEATADIRAAYVARYVQLELALLVRYREELAKVGMDAQLFAPYPNGNMGRAEYRQAQAKAARVSAWFSSTNPSRGWLAPNIVVERPEAELKLRGVATIAAEMVVDSYIAKLAGKIATDITSATTNGCIWDYALLDVTCTNGERQTWRTQCILNRSCLGKLFNQWPTRREK